MVLASGAMTVRPQQTVILTDLQRNLKVHQVPLVQPLTFGLRFAFSFVQGAAQATVPGVGAGVARAAAGGPQAA